LWEITKLNDEELLDASEALFRRQILEKTTPGEVRFCHSKIRQIALSRLDQNKRRRIHHDAAQGIEALYSDRLDPHLFDLAKHWDGAGEQQKATKYYIKAGDYYQKTYDHSMAITVYSNVLELLPDTDTMKSKALHQRGNIYKFTGKMEAAQYDYEQSLNLAKTLDNSRDQCMALSSLGALCVAQSRHDDAKPYLNEALRMSKEIDDKERECFTLFNFGIISRDMNEFEQAIHYYERSLTVSTEIHDLRMKAELLCHIGWIYQRQTKFNDALISN